MKMNCYQRWVLLIALVAFIFVGRLLIEPRLKDIPTPSLSYEAFAHIGWGVLAGVWLAVRDRIYFYAAALLALFELVMFFGQRSGIL